MSLDAPSRDQVPATATPQAERAAYQNERQAELESLRAERATLDQETCQTRWPGVPEHAADYLRQECSEHFTLAMEEAAKLTNENPQILNNPRMAERFLDGCITAAESAAAQQQGPSEIEGLDAELAQDNAEIAALDQTERGQNAEIAVLDQQVRQGDRRNATLRAEEMQVHATTEGLSNEVEGLARLRDIAQEESKKGGGVDALLQRVTARLSEIPDGPARQAAQEQLASVRAMLGQMRSVVTNPQERQAFESILSVSNLNLGASSNIAVFSDVMARVDSSDQISEETKTRLRQVTSDLPTGSAVNNVLDAVDEEGKPVFGKENQLPVRDGLTAYVAPDGSRVARVEVKGIGVREMPWERGQNGTVIGLKLSMLKIWAVNEARGNTDFFGETVNIDTQILSQSDPEKLRKVQQMMEALLGGEAGYDGEIISDEQADFIGWFSQYIATKGDASEGDFDENVADENRNNLGFHPGGDTSQLDYEVLRAAGLFAQGQYGSGEPDYYALQRHLHDLFPEKDIPLTGENAPDYE